MGIISGILLFSKFIEYAIVNHPKMTTSFFTFLILVTAPQIIKGMDYKDKVNIKYFAYGLIAMAIVIFLNLKYQETEVTQLRTVFSSAYYIKILICGIIAAGAMIIPGISGSLFLLIIGEYYNIVSYVNNFKIKPLFSLVVGLAIGILLFSSAINYLLKHYREKTMFFILAVVLLSIIQMWISII